MTYRVVRCFPVLAVLLAGVPAGAAAQNAPLPPRPAVAFPPAISALIGISSFGDRAGYVDTLDGSKWTQSLSNGLALTARVQSPLGRRFGLHAGAAVSRRSHRVDRDGSPQSSSLQHVVSFRLDGGLLFRFKPAAPMFFGAGATYYRHGASPLLVSSSGSTTELGWGMGFGVDFGRRPGSNVFGRVEYWSYWVQPKADSLVGQYLLRSRARDGALSVGVTYLLSIRPPAPRTR